MSDPYYLDSTCPNGRWDLIINPSSSLSKECIDEMDTGGFSNDLNTPLMAAHAMHETISENSIDLPMVDLTKPIGLKISS